MCSGGKMSDSDSDASNHSERNSPGEEGSLQQLQKDLERTKERVKWLEETIPHLKSLGLEMDKKIEELTKALAPLDSGKPKLEGGEGQGAKRKEDEPEPEPEAGGANHAKRTRIEDALPSPVKSFGDENEMSDCQKQLCPFAEKLGKKPDVVWIGCSWIHQESMQKCTFRMHALCQGFVDATAEEIEKTVAPYYYCPTHILLFPD